MIKAARAQSAVDEVNFGKLIALGREANYLPGHSKIGKARLKTMSLCIKYTVAPERGLEPLTRRLTAGCSTIELLWKQNGSETLQIDLRSVNEFPGAIARRISGLFHCSRPRHAVVLQRHFLCV